MIFYNSVQVDSGSNTYAKGRFPKLKAFLWTLDSRNIRAQKYGVSKEEDLEEQTKLVNSFLKLAYWY